MGSIVGGLFGGTSSRSTSTSGQAFPLDITGSGGSRLSIDNGVGRVSIRGGTRSRRRQLRNDIQGITRDVQNDILSLRSLENPFIRARVRPTEERFANLRADTQRGLDRRGVFGTFRTNELSRVDDAASAQIADQTALAQAQILDAVLQRQGFLSRLKDQLSGLNQQEVNQALAELGLGAQSAASLIRQTGASREDQGDPSEGIGKIFDVGSKVLPFFL